MQVWIFFCFCLQTVNQQPPGGGKEIGKKKKPQALGYYSRGISHLQSSQSNKCGGVDSKCTADSWMLA